jgi:hypothetical protein
MEIHNSIWSSCRQNGGSIEEGVKSWLNNQHSCDLKVLPLIVAHGIWIARNHAFYRTSCRLGKDQPKPQYGDN